ncbi:MAG: mannonate dehydratase, partial [Bacilli bacterium]|nr:mannonate dehydratase [Bacilli bacterium]
MKLGFRWYGENDSIPLNYIRQIPNMQTVVTSLYSFKPGEVWEEVPLLHLKELANQNGLAMDVIESIPVSENIKLGNELAEHDIEVFKKNLEVVAKAGVKVVCYNFMPVFDWLRTEMR